MGLLGSLMKMAAESYNDVKRETMENREKEEKMSRYEKASDKKLQRIADGKDATSIADRVNALNEIEKRKREKGLN